MLAHIEAIKAKIPAGLTAYYVDVPTTPTLPYVLLWSSAGGPGGDVPLCGPLDDIEDTIGVTCVAGTPEGALIVQKRVRAALSPDDARTPLAVAGRAASLKRTASLRVQVDRDVTIPATSRHPAYVVDLYDLHSTPA